MLYSYIYYTKHAFDFQVLIGNSSHRLRGGGLLAYRVKSNAFTAGSSLGNPAASFFLNDEELKPEQMQAIATEHKGFVMEVVFCGNSENADCKLSYYSSECEVDFCGHGTIATMYLERDLTRLQISFL